VQILWVVFASSREINKQKYAKTKILVCAGNKLFVKYQAQGGGYNPPPLAYALGFTSDDQTFSMCFSNFKLFLKNVCNDFIV